MLTAAISTFGQPVWIVCRRAYEGFVQAYPDFAQLEPRDARWVLEQVLSNDPPAELVALVGDPAVVSVEVLGERLRDAADCGGLVVFEEPVRAIEATAIEPQDLVTDELIAALEQHWIEVRLLDEDGQPRPGEPYRVTLSDNTEVSGRLDDRGVARIPDVPGGSCSWSFPALHPDEWAAAS